MTILDTIVDEKRKEVARLPERSVSVDELRAAMAARGERRDFLAALRRPKAGTMALIAEIKKASPSAGLIRPDFDPVKISREYEAAGADCLSVLTDEKFFQGSLEYLKAVRQAVKLPLLRKDFIIDERQILQAVEGGADAILLIVTILSDAQLKQFHALATEAGLAALVEVHDGAELERALSLGAQLVGVNNRNLKTFSVDLAATERLAAQLYGCAGRASSLHGPATARERRASGNDASPLLVAESGIHSRADVVRLARCGARALLVGESLMRHGDLSLKVRELMGNS